jgi:hypothetical protein
MLQMFLPSPVISTVGCLQVICPRFVPLRNFLTTGKLLYWNIIIDIDLSGRHSFKSCCTNEEVITQNSGTLTTLGVTRASGSTVYKEWYQVVKTQVFKFISYMMEVASNYRFHPYWWPSSGCTSKRKSKWVQCAKLYNFDFEISSILTVYVYISDNQIVSI